MKRIGEYWVAVADTFGFRRLRQTRKYEAGGYGTRHRCLTEAIDTTPSLPSAACLDQAPLPHTLICGAVRLLELAVNSFERRTHQVTTKLWRMSPCWDAVAAAVQTWPNR